MTQTRVPEDSLEIEALLRRRTAALVRSNEQLREELLRAQRECARLTRALEAAAQGSQADRQSRRAALNLMEDAVAARRAEQHENAERRRVEEELRQANRRKDEFLAMLAHELRTPLSPIQSGLNILRLGLLDEAGVERIHAMMDRQVCHVVRLVDDLMDVSRVTRGKVELRLQRVALSGLVQDAVAHSQPLIDRAGHQLSVQVPPEPLWLSADPTRIVQVLANLLNNAAKYMDPGGQIWLTATRAGADVEISVRDAGIGIPAPMLAKVFDLFTQLERPHAATEVGLGIGLTLVRALLELHGGSVQALSQGPGLGSEFRVRLPLLVEEADPGAGASDAQTGEPLVDHQILVVDDSPDAGETLGELLRLLGAKVQVVYSGAEALLALGESRPDAVLLDIGMPGMDGYELARRARTLPAGRAAMLIAVSGLGQEADRRASQAAGIDAHLVKPVRIELLTQMLTGRRPI